MKQHFDKLDSRLQEAKKFNFLQRFFKTRPYVGAMMNLLLQIELCDELIPIIRHLKPLNPEDFVTPEELAAFKVILNDAHLLYHKAGIDKYLRKMRRR